MFVHFAIMASITVLGSNGQIIFPSDEPCSNPWGIPGDCILINECSFLMNLLKNLANLSSKYTDILRNSVCGFVGLTPKVCCPLSTLGRPLPTVIPGPPDVTNHSKLGLVNNAICGSVTQSRISSGRKTTVLEFPWMALIGYYINGRGIDYKCGGTLINKRYVLTAAHCVSVVDHKIQLAQVRLGEHDLSTDQDCDEADGLQIVCTDQYQDFLIESFHAHRNYRTDHQADDIGLIRLDRDVDFRPPSVRPICLPVGDSATLRSKKALVTGWGRTEWNIKSQELLKVSLNIVSNEDCARIFEVIKVPIGYKQLCAGGNDRGDFCAGDGGGPLQYPGNINGVLKYIQYGIVSFGMWNCGVQGQPGVYTRVAYYMDWILDTITE